jgi:hypothetical protein
MKEMFLGSCFPASFEIQRNFRAAALRGKEADHKAQSWPLWLPAFPEE